MGVCVCVATGGRVIFYTKRLERASIRSFLIYDLKVNQGETGGRGMSKFQAPDAGACLACGRRCEVMGARQGQCG